jgi:hypothetical protein
MLLTPAIAGWNTLIVNLGLRSQSLATPQAMYPRLQSRLSIKPRRKPQDHSRNPLSLEMGLSIA